MSTKERILRPVKRIHGGAILPHRKNTEACDTEVMPAPEKVYIPLSQHIGAPCEPTVQKGDQVFVGTLIGKSGGYVSAPIHSSVSGTVDNITDVVLGGRTAKCIVISSDGNMTPDPSLCAREVNNADELVKAALDCGLVGLGGAGFPTHVKLSPSKYTSIDTLVVNGAECEPYITSDYHECISNYDDVIEGIYLIKKVMNLDKVVICIENNKPKAIEKLYRIASDHRDSDDSVKLMKLPATYPQGAEKVIIYSATGRVLPLGKLPSDVGCIVMNITSIGTLYRFIKTGMPLVSKRITFDGTAVENPRLLQIPIGTQISDVLAFTGVDPEGSKIIMGGPMMGSAAADVTAVCDKRTNAVLLMREEMPAPVTPCIRCGRCAAACPMSLYPASVEAAQRADNNEAIAGLNINACMECGSCAFVCPAKRPLVQVMRTAKANMRRNSK